MNNSECKKNHTLFEILKARELCQIENFKKEIAISITETFNNWKEKEPSLNQSSFAKLIGCSQPRVSNIINGNVEQFTVDKLLGFCSHLGINPILQTKPLKTLKSDIRDILYEINNG